MYQKTKNTLYRDPPHSYPYEERRLALSFFFHFYVFTDRISRDRMNILHFAGNISFENPKKTFDSQKFRFDLKFDIHLSQRANFSSENLDHFDLCVLLRERGL